MFAQMTRFAGRPLTIAQAKSLQVMAQRMGAKWTEISDDGRGDIRLLAGFASGTLGGDWVTE